MPPIASKKARTFRPEYSAVPMPVAMPDDADGQAHPAGPTSDQVRQEFDKAVAHIESQPTWVKVAGAVGTALCCLVCPHAGCCAFC